MKPGQYAYCGGRPFCAGSLLPFTRHGRPRAKAKTRGSLMAARPPVCPAPAASAYSAPARRHGKVRPRRGANKTFLLRPGLRFCAPGQAAKNQVPAAARLCAVRLEMTVGLRSNKRGGRGMASEAARRQAKNRSYYQARQRCKYCGRQDARTLIGKPQCFDCLEKRRTWERVSYPKYAEAHRAKCKERWDRRKAGAFVRFAVRLLIRQSTRFAPRAAQKSVRARIGKTTKTGCFRGRKKRRAAFASTATSP